MSNYILLSEKKWHKKLYSDLVLAFPNHNWTLLDSKSEFNSKKLKLINPDKVFIPHWSHIIPANIYENYECIVFHMTDLPYGRGGSPLQNLIINNKKNTKISALRVGKGIDTGDIYIKKDLNLSGSAQDIFLRSVEIIFEMVSDLILVTILPKKQQGTPFNFKRRNPDQSDISNLTELNQIYNYIRMLDADGYPNAFLEFGKFRLEFYNVKNISNNKLESNVRIFKK